MSKFQLVDGAFPPLVLTPEEEQTILSNTDEIIAETLHASEDFITQGRALDKHRWRLLKTKEQMYLYRTRKTKKKHLPREDPLDRPQLLSMSESQVEGEPILVASQRSSNSSSSTGASGAGGEFYGDSVIDRYRPPQTPLVIVTGVIDGTLEDAAFGMLVNSVPSWRMRGAYISDECANQQILATIQGPSEEDPFRFVGVKWDVRTFGPLIKPRDFLFAESTGMAIDSNGERISYALLHSIKIERVPKFNRTQCLRSHSSACYIFRTHSSTNVEVFCRAFSDSKGELLDSVNAALYAEMLLSINLVVEFATMKKLLWLMAQRHSDDSNGDNIGDVNHCHLCEKSLTKLFQSSSVCLTCQRMTCSKCLVTKKLSIDEEEGNIKKKSLAFCVPCMVHAKNLPSWDVAVATLKAE